MREQPELARLQLGERMADDEQRSGIREEL